MRNKPKQALHLKRDYEILAEFRYTLRLFLRFSEAAALKHQLTPQHYQALLAIEGYPSKNWVTIGELAERLQIASHSAVGLVDRLEKMNLVGRKRSPEDKRQVRVLLTSHGLKIFQKLYRHHREELKSIGPQLSALLRKLKNFPISSKSQESQRKNSKTSNPRK